MRIHNERGQALILLALAAIGFFAITGLAIDGSAKFSDRRHAQNAADTAALAGALELARNPTATLGGVPSWKYEAVQRAFENGYDNDLVSNTVSINNPPISGIYSDCSDVHFDCNDYVQVIIDSNLNTWFARVVGITQTHNHVEAVASKISANNNFNFGGNAVVALSPEGCALMGTGSIKLIVDGGGMYSNSDDPSCSFQGGTCASVVDVNTASGSKGTITLVGGYNAGKGCLPDATVIPAGTKQLPFPPPYEEIAPPDQCSQPTNLASNISFNKSTGTATLQPGHYTKLPASNKWTKMILAPGVYCIDTSVERNSNETMTVSGTFGVTPGVLLYIQAGGSFTFNGGSGSQLWGINQANVALDPSLSIYKGFLIYAVPNYASGSPAICKINGHSGDPATGTPPDKFMGTIFAPYCSINLSGTSDSSGWQSQIIGYEVKFAGGANVHLIYDASSSPVWNIPLQVGLSK